MTDRQIRHDGPPDDGEHVCAECGYSFKPEHESDHVCDLCQYHDRNDRAYQFGESER